MSEPDLLVLSPHLDDAALSCGGELAALGSRAHVVTVFGGDPGDEAKREPTPCAREVRRLMNLGPDALVVRRAEDALAMERLGVSSEVWSLGDAADRWSPDGTPAFAALPGIFDASRALSPDLLATLETRFEALRQAHPAARVLAPLGIGGHVDHRLVRRAAEAVWGEALRYGEDVPYNRRRAARWRVLGSPLRRRVAAEPSPGLDSEHREVKIHALAAYASQIGPLFGDAAGLRRAVESEWRRVGGEARWAPRRRR